MSPAQQISCIRLNAWWEEPPGMRVTREPVEQATATVTHGEL